MRRWPRLLPLGLALSALLAACDSGEPSGTPPPAPPSGDEIVAGVNLTQLFAAPTASEISAAEAILQGRTATVGSAYSFSLLSETTAQDGATYRVYRADAPDNPRVFHGLVRLPPRPPGDQRTRALLLVLPDGEAVTRDDLLAHDLPIDAADQDDYVYALLAYRGMALDVEGTDYESTLPSTAYNYDADDALAFLTFLRAQSADLYVDPDRIGVLGLGRGGAVALQTAARTPLYDLVIDLAGPTDFFLDRFRTRTRGFLNGNAGSRFPGFEAVMNAVVTPLQAGTLTLDEARQALLLRSPRYFFRPPPPTIVAHGLLDIEVFPDHSRVLDGVMGSPGSDYLEVGEADHASLQFDSQVISLVSTRLRQYLGGP